MPRAEAGGHDPDTVVADADVLHDLVAREHRIGQHDLGLPPGMASQPAPPEAFARSEPLGVREERHVVDRQRQRESRAAPARCRPGRKTRRAARADGAAKRRLLPPRAGVTGRQHPGGRTVRRQRQRDPVGREEHELPRRRILARHPSLQELPEIAPDSCRIAENLARVDADPEHGRRHIPARRRASASR